MSAIDWVVVATGIAAIAWVNWYFFVAEGRDAPAKGAAGKGGAARRGGGGRDVAKHGIDD
jgi:hypothetical protein